MNIALRGPRAVPHTRNTTDYDARFYRYIEQGSVQSARIVADTLLKRLPCLTGRVLDVGCGAGAWLAVFRNLSCTVLGLDGAHVARDMLLIDESEFREQDLREPFFLGSRFDLVLCLEVAEHLPASCARTLVESICRHGDVVLFSVAPPGQGGAAHVNEQPYAYWRDHFAACGYRMYDPLRRTLHRNRRVKRWYRYNSFVYVNGSALPDVHEALAAERIESDTTPPDIAPLPYRIRRHLVRLLPVGLVTALAGLRKRLFVFAADLR